MLDFVPKNRYNQTVKFYGGIFLMKAKKLFSTLLTVSTFALLSGCGAAAEGAGDSKAGIWSSLAMIAIMFVFMYVFMIRPENKRKKQADEMRSNIEVGDKITTIGGLVGRVVHVTNDRITFETGEDRVRVEVVKWAVSSNDGKASKEKADSEEVLGNTPRT